MSRNIWDIFRYLKSKKVALQDIQQMPTGLLEESTIELNYIVLIIGSCVIATLGLLSNSAAVIIGAMIVAPLMLPIRALAFGALRGNIVLFRKGLIAIVVGTLLSIVLAWSLGSLIKLPEFGIEVVSRSKPTLLDLGIAVAAGGISGFAKVQPKVSNTLAGTAIAVALMPPVCVIGLGLSQANWSLSVGATLLYVTNLLGITLSCMLTFLIAGCAPMERARKPLVLTLVFTVILLIPLSVSFVKLITQKRLEVTLTQELLNGTITFQRVQLIKSDFNWLSEPPQVHLTVITNGVITPKQVQLLEEFVDKEMGQHFTLIFEVSPVEVVRAENRPKSAAEPKPYTNSL